MFGFINNFIAGFNRQRPATRRHCVARIDHQIDNHLIKLAGINLDQANVAAMRHFQVDFFANQATQQVRHFRQRIGNVNHLGLQGLPTRKSQKLAHQIGRTIGILLNLHDIGKAGITRAMARQQQIAKADHRGQKVIEIMRHTTGQLPHRLHFLRLGKLFFQVFLFGGVKEVEQQRTAFARPSGNALQVNMCRHPARTLQAGFNLSTLAHPHHRLGQIARHIVTVFGQNQFQNRSANNLVAFLPGGINKGAVGIGDGAAHVSQNDRKRAFIKEPAHPALGFSQSMFPFMGGHRIGEDNGLAANRACIGGIDRMGNKTFDRLATAHLQAHFAVHTIAHHQVGQFHRAIGVIFGFAPQPGRQALIDIKNTAIFIQAKHPDRQAFDHQIGMFEPFRPWWPMRGNTPDMVRHIRRKMGGHRRCILQGKVPTLRNDKRITAGRINTIDRPQHLPAPGIGRGYRQTQGSRIPRRRRCQTGSRAIFSARRTNGIGIGAVIFRIKI